MEVREISWQQYNAMVVALDRKLQDRQPEGPLNIFGIPRGGALVALLLSYLDQRYKIVTFAEMVEDIGSGDCIVVDDVLETGKTRQEMSDYLDDETPYFAVLVDKSPLTGTTAADASVLLMDKKEWVKFPYEKLDLQQEKESQSERGYDGQEEG
jgi:hypoxanthine phosphoribosyltransferase